MVSFAPHFFMNKDKTKLYLEPILGELPDERINLKLKSIKRGKYEFDTKLKIGSYVQELFLKDKANSDGFDDIVYVYEDHLYDTSTANIFMIKGTEIITPKLEQRVLEGITRRKILEAIQVSERPIQYEELRDAKAVFLSSSLQGVIPVESVDGFEFDSVNHSLYKEVKAKLLSLMETYES
jgi:branched-subunit amino acid aminotransferase/4-amino-4-deoxychorismate lyase